MNKFFLGYESLRPEQKAIITGFLDKDPRNVFAIVLSINVHKGSSINILIDLEEKFRLT